MCSNFAVITMCANMYLAFILINLVSVFVQTYGFSCDRLIFGAFVVKFVLHWIQFSITKVNWKKPLEKMNVNFLRRVKWWYLCTLSLFNMKHHIMKLEWLRPSWLNISFVPLFLSKTYKEMNFNQRQRSFCLLSIGYVRKKLITSFRSNVS